MAAGRKLGNEAGVSLFTLGSAEDAKIVALPVDLNEGLAGALVVPVLRQAERS